MEKTDKDLTRREKSLLTIGMVGGYGFAAVLLKWFGQDFVMAIAMCLLGWMAVYASLFSNINFNNFNKIRKK